MSSMVVDRVVASAIDQATAGLDALLAAGVDPVDAADVAVLVRETEVLARKVRAVQLDQLTVIERRGVCTATTVTPRPR